jgi:mRNA-degrading endonuclease toxin of MazEF toxin-antitoxin module
LIPRRGEVFWASLPAGRKLVVVVSRDPVNELMQPVVARVTAVDRHRALPTHVSLERGEGGVERPSWILCHELYTLDAELLAAPPIGVLPAGRMIEVERALAYAFDLPVARSTEG